MEKRTKDQQKMIDEGYIDGAKSFEYMWSKIKNSFNFQKVHEVMKLTNWDWSLGCDSTGKDRYGIPSVETLAREVYRLMEDVYKNGKGSISTGGFSVGWDSDMIYVQFILEEAISE